MNRNGNGNGNGNGNRNGYGNGNGPPTDIGFLARGQILDIQLAGFNPREVRTRGRFLINVVSDLNI